MATEIVKSSIAVGLTFYHNDGLLLYYVLFFWIVLSG